MDAWELRARFDPEVGSPLGPLDDPAVLIGFSALFFGGWAPSKIEVIGGGVPRT